MRRSFASEAMKRTHHTITANRQSLPSAYGKDCRICCTALGLFSAADSEVAWNESSPAAITRVARCWSWRATCNASGVRIASTTTTAGLTLSLGALAKSPGGTFLAILMNAAEGDAAANDLMDSGTHAHADSEPADRMAKQQEEAPLPSVSAKASERETATVHPVDLRSASPEESSSAQENIRSTDEGLSGGAKNERLSASADETSTVISPASRVIRSSARLSAPQGTSGASFQAVPGSESKQNVSRDSLADPGAKTIAGAGSVIHPARQHDEMPLAPVPAAIMPAKANARGSSAVAQVKQQKIATEQDSAEPNSAGPVNGSRATNDAAGAASGERARTATSPASVPIPSPAETATPAAKHSADAIPFGTTLKKVQLYPSEQRVFPSSMLSGGVKAHEELSRTTSEEARLTVPLPAPISVAASQAGASGSPSIDESQRVVVDPPQLEVSRSRVTDAGVDAHADVSAGDRGTRQQAVPSPLIADSGTVRQPADAPAVDRTEPLQRFKTSEPASDRSPSATSSVIASGTSSHAALDEMGVSIPSPTQTTQFGDSLPRAFTHASERALPEDSLTDPALKTDSEAETNGRLAGVPVNASLPVIPSSEITVGSVAVKHADQDRASTDPSLHGQENAPQATDESSDAAATGVNVRAIPAAHDSSSSVPPAAQSLADNTLPQNTAGSSRTVTPVAAQSTPVAPVTPVEDKQAGATASGARVGNPSSVAVPVTAEVLIPQQDLASVSSSANYGISSQPLGNREEKQTAGATGAGNSVLPIAAAGATAKTAEAASKATEDSSKTTDTASGSRDTSQQHSAQNNTQPSPSAQADPSRAAEVAPKVADGGSSPAQAVAVQAGMPGAPVQHPAAAVADVQPRDPGQQDVPASIHTEGGEAVTASSINSAKLMQTISETEMHVGMRSTEFGDISIRTSISQQQLVAQISLDHSDLSQAISAHISTMQTKLGEDFGIRTSIEVHNMGSSLSGETGQSSQREQRSFIPSARIESALLPSEESAGTGLGALTAAGNGNRLDIRV